MAKPKLYREGWSITLPPDLIKRWRAFCLSSGRAQNMEAERAMEAHLRRETKEPRQKKAVEPSETLTKALNILMGGKE